MTSMVEKVARALWMVDCNDEDPDELCPFPEMKKLYGKPNWQLYADNAKAAIEAMIEPSDAILQACLTEAYCGAACCRNEEAAINAFYDQWQSAIKAALTEE